MAKSRLFDFLLGKSSIVIDADLYKDNVELSVKKIMIDHAINIVAKTCAKSTIDVYRSTGNQKKLKTKDKYFYKLNIRPNKNETGSSFWYRVFYKLLSEGKALVVSLNEDQLFLANNYEENDLFTLGRTYSNIEVIDSQGVTYKLLKTFSSEDVFLFDLGNSESVKLLEDFYQKYDSVISSSISNFIKNNISKFSLTTPSATPTMQDKDGKVISVKSYAERLVGEVLSGEDEVLQLPKGFELNDLSSNATQGDPAFIKTIKAWGDLVAMKFGIPLDIFWGTKTEKSQATDDLITFACLFPMQAVEDGLNAKIVTMDEYLRGDRVKFNKHTIKYRSALDISSSIDKLRAVGYSFNDIQEMLDEPVINENWANKRYVTKNYMDVINGGGKEVNE